MKIGNVDLHQDVLLIAEIGNNHEGDVELAERMIGLAADAGAHAVKFQTIDPERLVAAHETARIKQLSGYALSRTEHEHLAKAADQFGVMFISTPFFLDAVDWLEPLVPAFKIASGDNDFGPLLSRVAKTEKPVILSTGMSDLDDVKYSRKVINDIWINRNITPALALLHCISAYPTSPGDVNLSSMQDLAPLCQSIGFSDHTLGIEAAVLAVAAGARIIEKHFTIDKNQSNFRDHQLSADPTELKQLANRIVQANRILGHRGKKIAESEKPVAAAARRSIIARQNMPAGAVIKLEDLDWLRPGDGMSPKFTSDFIGHTLSRNVKCGEILSLDILN